MLRPFWKQDNKEELVVVATDKKFLRGNHRDKPIWKVSKGEEFMYVTSAEANLWKVIKPSAC